MKDLWRKLLLVGVGLLLTYGGHACISPKYPLPGAIVPHVMAEKVSNTALEEAILPLVWADRTRYSVYIAYPGQDRAPYIYQNGMMRSASMIKVFLLAAALEQVRDGQLSLPPMRRVVRMLRRRRRGRAGRLRERNSTFFGYGAAPHDHRER